MVIINHKTINYVFAVTTSHINFTYLKFCNISDRKQLARGVSFNRDCRATLKVMVGGSENTFSQYFFIVFKNVGASPV